MRDRRPSTAMSIDRRAPSSPSALRRGGTPGTLGVANACTSTTIGRCPSIVGTTADPGTPVRRSARNSDDASGTAIRPVVAISNSPSSLVGPKRCFDARNRRSAWCRSPSNCNTVSTTCSSTRGPARPPSLVTWPTSTIATPRSLASFTSRWAQPRTWPTLPGSDPSPGSDTVWIESITTSSGRIRSMASRMCASEVSACSHRSSRVASSRSARRFTCWALSSAVTYRVGPLQPASSWSSSVLLPIPGSPPSRVTEPATRPPPSTRSSSASPVDSGSPSAAPTSPIRTGPGRVDAGSTGSAWSPRSTSSTSVFQSPQPEHLPAHLGCAVPHSLHTWTTFALLDAMATIMTPGCRREATAGSDPAVASGWDGSVEADDLAAVDGHPVAGIEVRPQPVGDHVAVGRVLRALDLEEVGELEPRSGGLPQPERSGTGGWVHHDRTEQALGCAEVVGELGEEQRRHPVAAGGDHPLVLGVHLVVGGRIGDRVVDHPRIESDLLQQVPRHVGIVRPVALLVQRTAGALVPAVEVVHARPAQQRPDAHHRPAVGPLSFPRVLLALDPVDLLQAEELPVDPQPGLVTYISDPRGGLISERAHHVEVEVDPAGADRGVVGHAPRCHVAGPDS